MYLILPICTHLKFSLERSKNYLYTNSRFFAHTHIAHRTLTHFVQTEEVNLKICNERKTTWKQTDAWQVSTGYDGQPFFFLLSFSFYLFAYFFCKCASSRKSRCNCLCSSIGVLMHGHSWPSDGAHYIAYLIGSKYVAEPRMLIFLCRECCTLSVCVCVLCMLWEQVPRSS